MPHASSGRAPPHQPTRRAWMRAVVSACIWAPLAARSNVKELRVLTGPDTTPWRPLLQALRQRLPNMVVDSEVSALEPHRGGSPWLALGPQALRRALNDDVRAPVISALTSRQASPAAQMQLIAALFERRVTVGILLSEASAYLERPLRQAAQAAGLDAQLLLTSAGQDPVRAINNLTSVNVLLAVPDGTLYTPDALRAVLESTYRRGLPVIGFSAATVAAGTLACAHADLDDMAADLLDLLDGLPSSGSPLPEARYPKYWRVAINDNVARSLGLAVSDKVRALGARPTGRPS